MQRRIIDIYYYIIVQKFNYENMAFSFFYEYLLRILHLTFKLNLTS